MSTQGQESWVLNEADAASDDKAAAATPAPSAEKREWKIVWRNVILYVVTHIGGLYGAYLFLFEAKWTTNLFAFFLYICSGLGITAGVHRLWTHKSYNATWPLRLILVFFNTIAFQTTVIDWARDHRMHHKYSETDADPYNATRGFFFSHVGWLLVRKHPQIKAKGHTIDMSDLYADPILRFQEKYYIVLMLLACFILPTFIPTLWGETAWNAFFVAVMFRYIFVTNATWLVNSAAHMYGIKPYDKNMNPVENLGIALVVLGEGFHNYHHAFPWDYKTAELGPNLFNLTTLFIDAMSLIGWAYDLKTVSEDVIEKRVKRTGDGSHPVWGWDDKDILQEEKEIATIVNPEKTVHAE